MTEPNFFSADAHTNTSNPANLASPEADYHSDVSANSAAANQHSANKMLIIALVLCATIAVVFATLFFTSRASNEQAEQTPQTNQSQQASENDEQNAADQQDASTNNSAEVPAEVSQEVKEVIDAQHRLDPNDPMAKGALDAPVVIEIYADFRCVHCMNYSLNTEPQLAKRIANGEVRYEFNNTPVLGDDSVLAAQAAQAAANQNRFWEYHDLLFKFAASGNATYTDETLIELAKQAGVPDLNRFSSDLRDTATVTIVQSDQQRAQQLGISGVPAFLVGYSYVPGEIEIAQLNQLIDTELKR